MELTNADRSRLQSATEDMMACAANRDYRVADILHQSIAVHWGSAGTDYVLLLLAEEVIQYAADDARTPFARVVPQQALTHTQFEQVKERIHLRPEAVLGMSDMDMVCDLVAEYLNAVQRDDPDDRDRCLAQVRRGQPEDRQAMHDVILALAADGPRLPKPPLRRRPDGASAA